MVKELYINGYKKITNNSDIIEIIFSKSYIDLGWDRFHSKKATAYNIYSVGSSNLKFTDWLKLCDIK